MIIKRKSLGKTRTGIGWIQEELGKNESEKVFKKINDKIDKDYESGLDDEEIIKNAKKEGKKTVAKKDLPKVLGKSLGYGALAGLGTYGALKYSKDAGKFISEKIGKPELGSKISESLGKVSGHKGKLALSAGLLTTGGVLAKKKNLPKTLKRMKAAENGAEKTAETRLKKKG